MAKVKTDTVEPLPIDKPTRRTIETLFRDLLRRCSHGTPTHYAYRKADEEYDAYKEELEKDRKLQRLKKKRDDLWERNYQFEEKLKAKILFKASIFSVV